jgi:hypothetical protein
MSAKRSHRLYTVSDRVAVPATMDIREASAEVEAAAAAVRTAKAAVDTAELELGRARMAPHSAITASPMEGCPVIVPAKPRELYNEVMGRPSYGSVAGVVAISHVEIVRQIDYCTRIPDDASRHVLNGMAEKFNAFRPVTDGGMLDGANGLRADICTNWRLYTVVIVPYGRVRYQGFNWIPCHTGPYIATAEGFVPVVMS